MYDRPHDKGLKDIWQQNPLRKWWRNDAWPNVYHIFTDSPDRPPFFWLGAAFRGYVFDNKPINFWNQDDSYTFRVLRMADLCVPIGVAAAFTQYMYSPAPHKLMEQYTRQQGNTIGSTLKTIPVRSVTSLIPKNVALVWSMGAMWAVTVGFLTNNFQKDVFGEMFDLPCSVASYGSKEKDKHSIWHHTLAGVVAALTHHLMAGGSFGEPYYKKLCPEIRKINTRTYKLLFLLPVLSAFFRYTQVINEYQNDRAGVIDILDGPTGASVNEKVALQPAQYKGVEGGARDHKGRDISWLYTKVPQEKSERDYVPKTD